MYTARGSQSLAILEKYAIEVFATSDDLYDLFLIEILPYKNITSTYAFLERKLWTYSSPPAFAEIDNRGPAYASWPLFSFYANKTLDEVKPLNCAIQMNDSSDTAKINELVTALQAVFPDANYVVPS